MSDKFKKMNDFFDNPDNVAEMRKYFDDLDAKEKEFENKVIELHSKISEPEAFDSHVQLVIKEMQDKIDYCNKHHNGYELIDGELCFMNGTENFSVLFGYFEKYGKLGRMDEDFYEQHLTIGKTYKIEDVDSFINKVVPVES